MNNQQKLNDFFNRFSKRLDQAPSIIAETATEYYKKSFTEKRFGSDIWAPTKKPVKKGSLMVRTAALMGSIRPTLVTQNQVTISAGSSKVPYAKVHNEGGTINRNARSETFLRNRVQKKTKKTKLGQFRKGTTKGKGFTFKAYSYQMPKRQFMGINNVLQQSIINRIKKSIVAQ